LDEFSDLRLYLCANGGITVKRMAVKEEEWLAMVIDEGVSSPRNSKA